MKRFLRGAGAAVLRICAIELALLYAGGGMLGAQDIKTVSYAAVLQHKADSAALHFWDLDDSFSEMEMRFSVFSSILQTSSDKGASDAVNALMDKALLASSGNREAYCNPYDSLMNLAEKYFYSVESPYYCERLLLHFFDHKIARTDIAEIEKSREKFMSSAIRRNSVGCVAENFDFKPIDERCGVRSLYELVNVHDRAGFSVGDSLVSKPLMIVFFTADCRDCRDGVSRLAYSPAVRKQVSSGAMNVLAVCVEGNISKVLGLIPPDWIAATDMSDIVRSSTYSIRRTPSVYILDALGTVQLKDGSVQDAIGFSLDL